LIIIAIELEAPQFVFGKSDRYSGHLVEGARDPFCCADFVSLPLPFPEAASFPLLIAES
jgi:hypothetical protein